MREGGGIAVLILAAGYSSRMGVLKPLLPLAGSTVIEEAIRRFRAAGLEDISVVTGYKAEEITPVLDKLDIGQVFNPHYQQGMLSSVRAGIASLGAGVEAFFLLPADIPMVKPRTLQDLLGAWGRGGARIVYPCFQGRRGHPPLISRSCVGDLPLDFEGGLKDFLSRFDHEALDLEVVDESVLLDCDTPEDYCRLLAYELREDRPTRRECEAIWNRQGLPAAARAHGRLVAGLARMLAGHLNCAGMEIDSALVLAGGLLHDLAKGQPDHARLGARLLEDLGFGRVGEVVASHTDISVIDHFLDEAALIYLADKFVAGDRLVTLRERFGRALEKFGDRPDILKAIAKRGKDALTIKHRLEDALGIALEELIRRYDRSLDLAATGAPRTIYLARHGAIQPIGDGRHYLGQMDVPLSPEGRRQAEALRERLRQRQLSAIYCSDLQRSVETAAIIGEPHGLKPCPRPEFREIHLGAWEGLSFAEVRRRFPEEYEARGRDFIYSRPPGGESFLDLANRVLPALHRALASHPGNILIVGHAGVNRILLCHSQDRSLANLFDIPQDYGCLNLIRSRDADFGLELEALNQL
jgi:molybdenum cofactor cytidylyltransferase